MKIFKKYYLLLLLIITLTGVTIYGTYAMFTSKIEIDAINLEASNVLVDQEIMEYEKITITANDSKTISLNVSNSTNQTLHYGAWYQMISPSTINDNITIAKLTDSPDETSGTINGNSNKNVYIYIGNNSSSTITLYVGIKYSETSSLGLPDNRTLITNTRDGKYIVGVTVTNGTVENGKTITNLITNGSFENGSNGWSVSRLTTPHNRIAGTISSSKHATGNNSLYINDTSDTTGYWNYQYFTSTVGDQVYVHAKTNIISSPFGIGVNKDNTGSTSEFFNTISTLSGDFILYSRTYTATSTVQFFQIGSGGTANTSEGYFDDILVVNLTDSYGSNTPSQEILDRSISYFDGNASYNYVKLNKGNSTTFKVTPTSGYKLESVSCTNSNAIYNESNDTLTINNITKDVQCSVKFKEPTASEKTLQKLGLTANEGTPNFGSTATTDEGIYAAQDDYGTSYYFRGAVENNYVKFADKYWRIIRINGDGTIRLIYDGTSAHANGESSTDRQIGTSRFNLTYGDNAYVGYMMGIDDQCTSGSCSGSTKTTSYNQAHSNTYSSTIKKAVDSWYKTNIVDAGYSDKVADVIYCNDRQIDTVSGYGNALGYGTNQTAYMPRYRLYTNKSPILTCTNQNDRFTVEDTSKGNGALTYPVGLITADEMSMGGAAYGRSNSSYYLYTGNYYWTMSPSVFNGSLAYEFVVYSSGNINYFLVYNTYGVRPVISLKSDISVIGNGTQNDPYVVQ